MSYLDLPATSLQRLVLHQSKYTINNVTENYTPGISF